MKRKVLTLSLALLLTVQTVPSTAYATGFMKRQWNKATEFMKKDKFLQKTLEKTKQLGGKIIDEALKHNMINKYYYEQSTGKKFEYLKQDLLTLKDSKVVKTVAKSILLVPKRLYEKGYVDKTIKLLERFLRFAYDDKTVDSWLTKEKKDQNISTKPLPEQFFVFPGLVGLSHDKSHLLMEESQLELMFQESIKALKVRADGVDEREMLHAFQYEDLMSFQREFNAFINKHPNEYQSWVVRSKGLYYFFDSQSATQGLPIKTFKPGMIVQKINEHPSLQNINLPKMYDIPYSAIEQLKTDFSTKEYMALYNKYIMNK